MELHDAILFHNELELLEIRLHELGEVVDRFVIVEATRTFRGEPKPLVFGESRHRFSDFTDRIDHLVVDDMPVGDDPWVREHHQRDAMARAFAGVSDDTIVLISDADEIPSRQAVEALRASLDLPAGFVQPVHYGWVDVRSVTPPSHLQWIGTRACWARNLEPQRLRERPAPELASVIDPGGWHFSYLGGAERVARKLEAYSHEENDTSDIKAAFHDALRMGEDPFGRPGYRYERVAVTAASHPRYLAENLDRFDHLVLGAASLSP